MPKTEITVTTRIDAELLVRVKRLVSASVGLPPEVIPNATAIKLSLEAFAASGGPAESPATNPRCDSPKEDSAPPLREVGTTGAPKELPYPSVPSRVPTSQQIDQEYTIPPCGAPPLTKHDVEARLSPLFRDAINAISSRRFDGLELTEPTPDERPLGEFKRALPWSGTELAPWSRIKDPEAYEASDAKDTALVLAYRVLYSGIPRELQSTERSREMLNNILPAFRQAVADHPDKLPPEEVIFYSDPETP